MILGFPHHVHSDLVTPSTIHPSKNHSFCSDLWDIVHLEAQGSPGSRCQRTCLFLQIGSCSQSALPSLICLYSTDGHETMNRREALSSRVVMGWRTETDEHIVMSHGQCHEEESLPCRESKTGSQQQWSWTDRCWQVDRAPEIRGHGSRKGRFFPEEEIVHTSLQDSLKPGYTRTQGMCPEWPGCWETCTPTSCLLLVPPPPPEVNSFPFLLLRVLLILNRLKICFLHKAFQDYTLNRQALNSILFLYIVIQRVHNRSQLPTKL